MLLEKRVGQKRSKEEQEEILSDLSSIRKEPKYVGYSLKMLNEVRELRDRPVINEVSRRIAESLNHKVPLQKRWKYEVKRKKRNLDILKQRKEEEQKRKDIDLTFQPKINKVSRNMNRQKIHLNVGTEFDF